MSVSLCVCVCEFVDVCVCVCLLRTVMDSGVAVVSWNPLSWN